MTKPYEIFLNNPIFHLIMTYIFLFVDVLDVWIKAEH